VDIDMAEFMDRISGRLKKAAGDITDDASLREQGVRDERKADAKEDLARAQREADERAEEVARLERETARGAARRTTHSAEPTADAPQRNDVSSS
jgi:uncharacterized protein YjbJ (UPF0337 family)